MSHDQDEQIQDEWQQFLEMTAFGDVPADICGGNQAYEQTNLTQVHTQPTFANPQQVYSSQRQTQPTGFTHFPTNRFVPAPAISNNDSSALQDPAELPWPMTNTSEAYGNPNLGSLRVPSVASNQNYVSNIEPPQYWFNTSSLPTQMVNQQSTIQSPALSQKRKSFEPTQGQKDAQLAKRRQRHLEYRVLDGQLYGAVEKPPTDGLKKIKEKCLSCVAHGRSCAGNQLIGDMCQMCIDNRNNCYWYDPDRGIFSYEDAQRVFNSKQHLGPIYSTGATMNTTRGGISATSAFQSASTPQPHATTTSVQTSVRKDAVDSNSDNTPIPTFTGHFRDLSAFQHSTPSQTQITSPFHLTTFNTTNPEVKQKDKPVTIPSVALAKLNNLGINLAEEILTHEASIMWKFKFLSGATPEENFNTLYKRLKREYEEYHKQTEEDWAYKKVLDILDEMKDNGEAALSYQVMYDWAAVYQEKYEPEYDFGKKKKGKKAKQRVAEDEEEEVEEDEE